MGIGKNLNDGLRSRRGGPMVVTQATIRQEAKRDVAEQTQATAFDAVSFIMDYEDGNLTEDEVVEGFKYLIRTGLIRSLQGHYQRQAQAYIDNGVI